MQNVKIENYGLADENCTKEFTINTKHRGGNSFLPTPNGGNENIIKMKIKCSTLLNALENNNVTKIDILKMDIEGFEYPTLKEYFKSANQNMYPNYILLEEWGDIIKRFDESVVELLIHNGYKLIDHYKDNFFFESKGK